MWSGTRPRANQGSKAGECPWSSLLIRQRDSLQQRVWLSAWPVPRPRDWRADVNGPETEAELAALRHSIQRDTPYGSDVWVSKIVAQLGLQSALRRCVRPRNWN